MFVKRSGETPQNPPHAQDPAGEPQALELTTPTAVSGRKLISKMKKPSKSIIDAGVVVTGTVACTGELEVLGQIQGDLHCSTLMVTQPGHIRGDVFAENAMIDGRVDGTIRCKQVILRSAAHVTGDIHHASLVIEHGAIFEGKVRRSNNPTQVQTAPAPVEVPQQQAAYAQPAAAAPAPAPTPAQVVAPQAPAHAPQPQPQPQPAAPEDPADADPALWAQRPVVNQ